MLGAFWVGEHMTLLRKSLKTLTIAMDAAVDDPQLYADLYDRRIALLELIKLSEMRN